MDSSEEILVFVSSELAVSRLDQHFDCVRKYIDEIKHICVLAYPLIQVVFNLKIEFKCTAPSPFASLFIF